MQDILERIADALERIARAAELQVATVRGKAAAAPTGPIELRLLATPGGPLVMRFKKEERAVWESLETEEEKIAYREAVAQARLNALLATGSGKAGDETSALVSAIMAGPAPTLKEGDAEAGMAMF